MPRIVFQSSVFFEGRKDVAVYLPRTYEKHHLELVLNAFDIKPHHASDFYISCHGHIVQEDDVLSSEFLYRMSPRLRGGKGGFGSMLRAIGAQIEKTTSREACRDLSGRRMRDVNNEKKLKDWVARQANRETEKAERKRERRERQKVVPEHKFVDRQYDEQKLTVKENLEDALQQGLKRQPVVPMDNSRKRKNEGDGMLDEKSTKRKAVEWLGLDPNGLSDLSSSSDEGDIDEVCPLPFTDSDRVGSSAGSNMSTAVQFSDADSKASSEWENLDRFVDMENCDSYNDPVHSDELLERIDERGECSKSDTDSIRSERGEYSKSDIGSSRSERGECSRSDAGSIRSERGECSKSDASSLINELSDLDQSKSIYHGSVGYNVASDSRESNAKEYHPLVLEDYEEVGDFHVLGLERLKMELMSRGLKCGGTLEQRAERLFSVKGLSHCDYPPSIISKGGKSKSSKI